MKVNSGHIIKHILFGIILLCVLIPLVQSNFELTEESDLKGAYVPEKNVIFTKAAWFSGELQEQKAAFLNEDFGFRSSFVLFYNQLRYSLFSQANSKGIEVGKNEFLFETGYINAHLGSDFLGSNFILSEVDKLIAVRDSLQKLDVDLLIVFAPNKASYYPEYIPDSWDKIGGDTTNFETYKRLLETSEFNLLDVKTWFEHAKDSSRFPLFPKTGTHWSKYGETIVLDSLIRRIGQIEDVEMANIKVDSTFLSNEMHDTDNDIEKSMNLYYDIPKLPMAYPKIRFVQKDTLTKPRVLTIADSFFWGLYNTGFTVHTLQNSEFWYYFNEMYSDINRGSNKVAHQNLAEELERNDLIILLTTDANLKKGLGFGFINAAYAEYFDQSLIAEEQKEQRRILYFKAAIVSDVDWYDKIKDQAKLQHISVEEALQNNAEYLVWKESIR